MLCPQWGNPHTAHWKSLSSSSHYVNHKAKKGCYRLLFSNKAKIRWYTKIFCFFPSSITSFFLQVAMAVSVINIFLLEEGYLVDLVGTVLTIQLRITPNFWFYCFYLQAARNVSVATMPRHTSYSVSVRDPTQVFGLAQQHSTNWATSHNISLSHGHITVVTYQALIPLEQTHSKPGAEIQVCYHSCQWHW